MKYFSLAQTGKTAEIFIFGDIVSWEMIESDVSSYTLAKSIAVLPPDVDQIDVHINSYGGDVAEGLAIYNVLRNHSAKIRTICDGFACSIASVVFMAGDERIINPASLLMIHNAWSFAAGNAAELRKQADDLDVITSASKAAYLTHINISEEDLTELMNNESWITPENALQMGFATAIAADGTTGKASQSARQEVFKLLAVDLAAVNPAKSTGKKPKPEAKAENAPEPEKAPEENEKNAPRYNPALCRLFEKIGGNVNDGR